MPESLYKSNDIDIFYRDSGEKVSLLLLHGFTGSGEALVPIFKDFVDEFRLIVKDIMLSRLTR